MKYAYLVGQTFGQLKPIRAFIKNYQVNYECTCSCGKTIIVRGYSLVVSKQTMCRECFENKRNLIGKRFGKLIVQSRGGYRKFGKQTHTLWNCLCDCGKIKEIPTANLIGGSVNSCGCIRSYQDGETPAFNSLLLKYKTTAKKKSLGFSLSEEEFRKLTKGKCEYCGIEPIQIEKNKKNNYIYNGIDRIDNSKGYTLDNCISCCKICNYAKKTATKESFLKWIIKVYKHNNKEKENEVINSRHESIT